MISTIKTTLKLTQQIHNRLYSSQKPSRQKKTEQPSTFEASFVERGWNEYWAKIAAQTPTTSSSCLLSCLSFKLEEVI
jgi:hypothetical protein